VRTHCIALHQSLPHWAGLRAREGNQTLIQLLQPAQLDHRLCLTRVLGMRSCQKFRQVQVTLLALHQQHHAGGGSQIAAQAL